MLKSLLKTSVIDEKCECWNKPAPSTKACPINWATYPDLIKKRITIYNRYNDRRNGR